MKIVRDFLRDAVDVGTPQSANFLDATIRAFTRGCPVVCKHTQYVTVDSCGCVLWENPTEHVITDIRFEVYPYRATLTFLDWRDNAGHCMETCIDSTIDTSGWFIPNWILPQYPPTIRLSSAHPCYVKVTWCSYWFGAVGTRLFINNTFVPSMDWISSVVPGATVLINNPSHVYNHVGFDHAIYTAACFSGIRKKSTPDDITTGPTGPSPAANSGGSYIPTTTVFADPDCHAGIVRPVISATGNSV